MACSQLGEVVTEQLGYLADRAADFPDRRPARAPMRTDDGPLPHPEDLVPAVHVEASTVHRPSGVAITATAKAYAPTETGR